MIEVNQILNIDCREGFKLINDNYADLIVTDPPYDVQAQGCGGGEKKWKGGSRFKGGNSVFGVETSEAQLFEYVKPKDYMSELSRIIKPDGHIYVFTNDKNLSAMQVEAEKHDLKLMNILVVNKLQGTYFSYYQKYVEFILFFRSTKGKAKYINNCGKGNYFEYRFSRGKEKLHKSEKPLELIKELILQSSQEGEIVFDPFMGSGTTAVASIKTNRKYIGFELDKDFYELETKRIREHLKEII
jgi:site-specific DNA-methyltransferase (adenine-specific)